MAVLSDLEKAAEEARHTWYANHNPWKPVVRAALCSLVDPSVEVVQAMLDEYQRLYKFPDGIRMQAAWRAGINVIVGEKG